MSLLADLRAGFRQLGRQPGAATAALVSLTLGIGANAALYSVLQAVVLRPLPYPEPGRLVKVWETAPDNDRRWVAPANFLDWRREVRSFEGLAAYDTWRPALTGLGEAQRLRAVSASGSFFELLGVPAALGRTLRASDDAPEATPVAVLSHGLGQRLFGDASAALGRTLVLDGIAYEVVGLLDPGFRFEEAAELFVSGRRGLPASLGAAFDDPARVRDAHLLYALGRLRPGVALAQAQAEMDAVARRLEQAYPATNTGLGVRLVPLHDDLVADARRPLLLLQGAVALLLLIACANVAHLLLARGAQRERELAVRFALGASPARVVGQLLAEALPLALVGAAGGLALAAAALARLPSLAPGALPRREEVVLDLGVVAVAVGAALATVCAAALVPAWRAARGADGLRAGARTVGGPRLRRLSDGLAVAELALAHVLVAGAGLLLASFLHAQATPLGFAPQRRLAVELSLSPSRAGDPAGKRAFVEAALARLAALPGVDTAAASLTVPLGGAVNRGVRLPGQPAPPAGQEPTADFQAVSPGFFETLGIPVLRGRAFGARDGTQAPRVAVVSAAMAQRFWPGRDPIGERVAFGRDDVHEIVGVVGDVRQRAIERAPEPAFYVPLAQNEEPWSLVAFTLRHAGSAAALAAPVRAALQATDSNQPISRLRTLDAVVADATGTRRLTLRLVVAFAGVALLLAALGTYAVLAFVVATRRRELGVRMALGAAPRRLLVGVLGRGLRLAAPATLLGLAGAAALARALQSLLYGVSPLDPGVLAATSALLVLAALAAAAVPARRVLRVDPVVALRQE